MSGEHLNLSPQSGELEPGEIGFGELEDAMIRTAYWCTFGPLMPAPFAARFREHAARMPLEHARHDLEHCFRQYPERRFA